MIKKALLIAASAIFCVSCFAASNSVASNPIAAFIAQSAPVTDCRAPCWIMLGACHCPAPGPMVAASK